VNGCVNTYFLVRLEVFTAVTMKKASSVMLCHMALVRTTWRNIPEDAILHIFS
jgi:hypothetical protein